MKTPIRWMVCSTLLLMMAGVSFAATEATSEPNQLFYQGNTLYQEGNYIDALLKYDTILRSDLESGTLYYNIGNSFLKLNRRGYAILFYERAMRIIPFDSDVRSNLSYALSLADQEQHVGTGGSRLLRALTRPVLYLPLGTVMLVTLAIYLLAGSLVALSLVNPLAGRRIRIFLVACILAAAYMITVLGMRYYNEVILTYGIVVAKSAPCSYEPIDKSTKHYTVREGSRVLVLTTRNGWRQIKRADGKIGWLKKEAVEPI